MTPLRSQSSSIKLNLPFPVSRQGKALAAVGLVLVALLLASAITAAREAIINDTVITNDTGKGTTGLRVLFSTLVQITGFGEDLTEIDQTGLSYEFVFSSEVINPEEAHWFSYAPTSARVLEYEWLSVTVPVISAPGNPSREGVGSLGSYSTYEEEERD